MTTQQLNQRFWTSVETAAKGFQLGIGTDCKVHLKNFISVGVNQLQTEGLLNNVQKCDIAETNLIAFVGGMAYEAKLQNLTELREFTFFGAKQRFCPLWPFC